jgi:hypothetical protein
MLRKAAILAAESDGHDVDTRGKLVVTQDHVNQAIDELLIAGGVITQRLLGVAPPAASS